MIFEQNILYYKLLDIFDTIYDIVWKMFPQKVTVLIQKGFQLQCNLSLNRKYSHSVSVTKRHTFRCNCILNEIRNGVWNDMFLYQYKIGNVEFTLCVLSSEFNDKGQDKWQRARIFFQLVLKNVKISCSLTRAERNVFLQLRQSASYFSNLPGFFVFGVFNYLEVIYVTWHLCAQDTFG